MKVAFWLAWRELNERRSSFMAGVTMITVAVALCTAVEFLSRARERAVGAEIDHMGPSLQFIPAGRTSRDLARFELGSNTFTETYAKKLGRELSSWIRSMDIRLLLREPLEGIGIPVIGIDPGGVVSPFEALGDLGETDAVLGSVLAERLGKKPGDRINFKGIEFRVAAVLSETASIEDLSMLMPISRLRALSGLPGAVNVIRIFPRSGKSIEKITAHIESNHPKIHIVNMYRGDTAEHGIGERLRHYRGTIYLIISLVVALCALIWSYLNARERRVEMATLVATGATGVMVLSVLIIRSAILGLLGSISGYMAGAAIALVQYFEPALGEVLSLSLLLEMSGLVSGLSILGAIPASTFTAFREHINELSP